MPLMLRRRPARLRVGGFVTALASLLLQAAPSSASDFLVFNQADDLDLVLDGTLRDAVRGLNLQDDEESFIFFDIPTSAPVLLQRVLPDIEQNVEIVADPLFPSIVRKVEVEEGEEVEYDILRVSKGTTMIDGVVFRDGPITVGIDPIEGGDARLGFRYAEGQTVVFDETITGLGGVIKEGAGELILTGENDFEAGLLVTEGRLIVDNRSLTGDAEVEEDGLLGFAKFDRDIEGEDEITPETYAGKVTGEGSVEKRGFHDLELVGEGLLHTGGTDIIDGSITATPTTFPGDVSIGADANLIMDLNAGDDSWAGNSSGDGAIAKTGTGTLTLAGEHTSSGGFFVDQGALEGAAANLPKRVELAGGLSSELVIVQPDDATYAGRIDGDGVVIKDGAGTLTLTGANGWDQHTEIQDGRLRGSLDSIDGDVTVQSTGTLELIVNDARTYDGVVSGTGDLVKTGSGQLTIGQSQTLTGLTTISSGTLELLTGAGLDGGGGALVAAGGVLTGDGSVAGALDVQGTLRPGNGLGTSLNTDSSVTLGAGSTLEVEVRHQGGLNEQTNLIAGGAVTLEGGTVDVTVNPGDYTSPRSFVVVDGASIIDITPVALTPTYAFVEVTIDPAALLAGNVEVVVEENGANASIYAQTENQVEVAGALDEMLSNPVPGLTEDLRESLVSVTVEELPDVLDQMSAAPLAMLFTQRIESGHRFARAISRRFTAGRYEDSPPKPKRRPPSPYRARDEKPVDRMHRSSPPREEPTPAIVPDEASAPAEPVSPGPADAATSPPPSTPPVSAAPGERTVSRYGSYRDPVPPEGGVGVWGDVFGVFGKIEGGEQGSDIKTRLYGMSLGLDYRFADGGLLPEGHGLRLGGAFDYGRARPEASDGHSESAAHLIQLAGHASWTHGPVYAGVVGRYGYMTAESQRHVIFGDLDDTASGDFDGQDGGVYTEAGARFDVGRRMLLQPRVGFEWNRLSQSGFTESGAPGLDLEVDSASVDSLRTFVGANLATHMTMRGRFGIEPEVRLGWSYEFGDIERRIDARFTGAAGGGGAFSTAGAQTSRHDVLFGAGYTMRVSNDFAIALDYDGRVGGRQTSHSIGASAYVKW